MVLYFNNPASIYMLTSMEVYFNHRGGIFSPPRKYILTTTEIDFNHGARKYILTTREDYFNYHGNIFNNDGNTF